MHTNDDRTAAYLIYLILLLIALTAAALAAPRVVDFIGNAIDRSISHDAQRLDNALSPADRERVAAQNFSEKP